MINQTQPPVKERPQVTQHTTVIPDGFAVCSADLSGAYSAQVLPAP